MGGGWGVKTRKSNMIFSSVAVYPHSDLVDIISGFFDPSAGAC
jgi:hypothetical protein